MTYFTTRGADTRNDDLKYLKGPGMNKNTGGPCGRGWVGVKGHCKRKAKGGDASGQNKALTMASRRELADRIRTNRGMRSVEESNQLSAETARKAKAKASRAKTKAKKAAKAGAN
jgi:hypothetical protein